MNSPSLSLSRQPPQPPQPPHPPLPLSIQANILIFAVFQLPSRLFPSLSSFLSRHLPSHFHTSTTSLSPPFLHVRTSYFHTPNPYLHFSCCLFPVRSSCWLASPCHYVFPRRCRLSLFLAADRTDRVGLSSAVLISLFYRRDKMQCINTSLALPPPLYQSWLNEK